MKNSRGLERGVAEAVQSFWQTRAGQMARQQAGQRRDQGGRSAVTAGKQMDGFISLVRQQIVLAGVPDEQIFTERSLELPGYYRPEKKWDLLVIDRSRLLVAMEFKSQIGPSFGNNFNNRAEEAIGTAHDVWTAYREGAFPLTPRPWLGYLMLLEDSPKSTTAVATREPHFAVLAEFRGSSYAERYRLLIQKLIRERHYDAGCFLLSSVDRRYSYPDPQLAFQTMLHSLVRYLGSAMVAE
jgi:hypothetical protein